MLSKRVRVKYRKKYPAFLIGHLDTVKEILRGMRRAAWQFEFTAGFNPTIKYSSTPALSLGFLSEAEYIDVCLTENVKEFKKAEFTISLAEGLQIIEITELSPGELPINDKVKGFRYEIASKDGQEIKMAAPSKSVKLVKKEKYYIILDTFKRDGGIKNPRKGIKEGKYAIKKLSCIFS
ncbi:MAG: TIGR03936 family radical SAM-associated protein [Elusimicrobia bacterium]|jgi:radical SAM-linked protein|nr:TIGR03936 family radical SAM-associated protein [Elusimicrobiota bacterium]